MDSIALVRLKTGDKSLLTRETSVGDETSLYYKLKENIFNNPDIQIRVSGVIVTNYTVDYENGVVTFDSPPAKLAPIEFVYYWAVYSDAEVQGFLDDSGGEVTTASAKLLLAMAADAAKVAKRITMGGRVGGGTGTTDTSLVARELRATAESLIKLEGLIGDNAVPYDQLTEPIWTVFGWERQYVESLIRKS